MIARLSRAVAGCTPAQLAGTGKAQHRFAPAQRVALACAAIAVYAVGCTRTNVALMDNSVHLARICPDAVKIFSSPSKVLAEYQEVALLNSTGNTGFTSEAGMMKSMRQKAAEVGANGIIMGNIDEPSTGAKIAGAIFGTGAERKGKSVAILIPSDSVRVRKACSAAS